MWHAITSRHDDSPDAISVALWTLAGIIAVNALGDALTVLAVVLAIVIMAGWICRGVELRMASSKAEIAHVCHSRPAFTGQRDVNTAWSSVMWWAGCSGVDSPQIQGRTGCAGDVLTRRCLGQSRQAARER